MSGSCNTAYISMPALTYDITAFCRKSSLSCNNLTIFNMNYSVASLCNGFIMRYHENRLIVLTTTRF